MRQRSTRVNASYRLELMCPGLDWLRWAYTDWKPQATGYRLLAS
jgi:hypothetical protein